MQTLVMPELRNIPDDGRLDAFSQGEADSEAVRTERACYLPCVVFLVECQAVQGILVLFVELLQ